MLGPGMVLDRSIGGTCGGSRAKGVTLDPSCGTVDFSKNVRCALVVNCDLFLIILQIQNLCFVCSVSVSCSDSVFFSASVSPLIRVLLGFGLFFFFFFSALVSPLVRGLFSLVPHLFIRGDGGFSGVRVRVFTYYHIESRKKRVKGTKVEINKMITVISIHPMEMTNPIIPVVLQINISMLLLAICRSNTYIGGDKNVHRPYNFWYLFRLLSKLSGW